MTLDDDYIVFIDSCNCISCTDPIECGFGLICVRCKLGSVVFGMWGWFRGVLACDVGGAIEKDDNVTTLKIYKALAYGLHCGCVVPFLFLCW